LGLGEKVKAALRRRYAGMSEEEVQAYMARVAEQLRAADKEVEEERQKRAEAAQV